MEQKSLEVKPQFILHESWDDSSVVHCIEKKNPDPYLILYIKIQFKWFLNIESFYKKMLPLPIEKDFSSKAQIRILLSSNLLEQKWITWTSLKFV